MNQKIETFKARLIAEGHTEGINYDETFSLVAMPRSTRILLYNAAAFAYDRVLVNGSQDIILSWPFWEKYLYRTTKRVQDKWTRRDSLQVIEIHLSIEESFSSWNMRFDRAIISYIGGTKYWRTLCL